MGHPAALGNRHDYWQPHKQKVLPRISGQVIEGPILDLSTPPRMSAACVAMATDFRDGGAFFLTVTSFP